MTKNHGCENYQVGKRVIAFLICERWCISLSGKIARPLHADEENSPGRKCNVRERGSNLSVLVHLLKGKASFSS